ncbi:MAG: NUDIX hydrolase [Syntrophobacterales bacterium]|nr:NUDIX hydrolase [Syntrophobacterales bacterium]
MPIRPWRLVSTKSEKKWGLFQVRVDEVVMPSTGRCYSVYALDFAPWANIIAITPDDQVVLVRQYRHGIREITLELPGGVIDGRINPEVGARRELLEETGYDAQSWELVGRLHPNPAIQTNVCYTFLARNAYPATQQHLDELEEIEVVLKPIREIPRLLKEGVISHALIVAAFGIFFLRYPEYWRA